MSSVAHQQAQALAAQAGRLVQAGRGSEARPLYERAAELEKQALEQVPPQRVRTRGIHGVSLAALLYKAGTLDQAEATVHALLAQADLLPPAREELRELLKVIWHDQAAARRSSAAAQGS